MREAGLDRSLLGTRIPTLDEVLDLLRGKALVNIELKVLYSFKSSLGADVVTLVRRHGMADQVVLSSFNPFALRRRQAGRPGDRMRVAPGA